MTKLRVSLISSFILAVGYVIAIFSSCSEKSLEGMIICTRVAAKLPITNFSAGDSERYIPQAQIVAVDRDNPGGSIKVLTSAYYSAHSPEISFDGKFLLFSAQLKQNDPWQIYEMSLTDLKIRQVTTTNENCTNAAYLPTGRIVFSKLAINDPLKGGHSLYTCDPEGSDIRRITFNPNDWFASNTLNDGRILTISAQVYPERKSPMFMILRPDGTKSDLLYKGCDGSLLTGSGRETIDGKIVFIESEKSNQGGGSLISISYNRPQHSRVNLSAEIKGDFRAAFPEPSGKLLVSYRISESDRYALYEFDPVRKVPGKKIYADKEYDVLEAIVIGKRQLPKRLPSEVDMSVKTGQLLCQDIHLLDPQATNIKDKLPGSSRVELIGLNSSLGTIQVEEDGSFYLKVVADTPFRIQSVDNEGHVLQGPCGWIWLRPNERRGCVGCHEDHELSPDNRVPLAVKKSPVTIPVHLNNGVEKKVLAD